MRTRMARWMVFSMLLAVGVSALARPVPAHAQALTCPATAGTTDPSLDALLSEVSARVNQVWFDAAGQEKIDPLAFKTGDVTGPCPSDGGTDCFFGAGLTNCLHSTARFDISNLLGLKSVTFQSMAAAGYNPKDVSSHTERGPEAGKITDGVFANDGTSWNHPSYTVVLPLPGVGSAVTIDLGAAFWICGPGVASCAPVIQADRHPFQFDYSLDGISWTSYSQVITSTSDGLRTRGLGPVASGQDSQKFNAKFVRLYGLPSDDTNFSISEVQLKDTTGKIISLNARAVGPRPYQIADGVFAKAGTTWNDKNYAVVLRGGGAAHAIVIDLGDPVKISGSKVCSQSIAGPIIQADKNEYQVDYSTDGVIWIPYSQVPTVSSTGLQTRGLTAITSGHSNPDFTARYVRIWGLSGDGNYSVSEMALYSPNCTTLSVSSQTVTYGPEGLVTDGEIAPAGTDWNDSRYARILSPCPSSATCPRGSRTGTTGGLVVDFGAAFPISALEIQADRHEFQIDYWDGASASWKALATVPAVSGSGLLVRPVPFPSVPITTQRLLVYGIAGDDSNYSVSSVRAYTPVANTACAYDPVASAGQDFSCSYDGLVATQLAFNTPGASSTSKLMISFTVDLAEGYLRCTNGTSDGSTPTKTLISSGTACSAVLTAGPPQGFNGEFCSGVCATDSRSVLSHLGLGLPNFQVDPTTITCTSDSSVRNGLAEILATATATAVQSLFDGLVVTPLSSTTPPMVPTGICAPTVAAPDPDSASRLQGRASRVGSGTDSGAVQMSGRFTLPPALPLNAAGLTLDAVLHERDAGELVRAAGGAEFLPLKLQARSGSTATAAIYQTPTGARPGVKVEVKTRDAASGLMEFTMKIDRAIMPDGPDACPGGTGSVPLETRFSLHRPGEAPIVVHVNPEWRCLGSELRLP